MEFIEHTPPLQYFYASISLSYENTNKASAHKGTGLVPFLTSGQSVQKLVGAPLVVSLGLLQSGIVEYLVKLDHHLFNVGRLKASPLHRVDDVPPAGIVTPRLGEQGRQFWIVIHRAFPFHKN